MRLTLQVIRKCVVCAGALLVMQLLWSENSYIGLLGETVLELF